MATINTTLNVQVVSGPRISISTEQQVEAYDKIDVVIAAGGSGATPQVFELQPGAAEQVSLLLIKSSLYSENITYTVNDGNNDSDPIALNEPHFYQGTGMVALLGSGGPQTISITNGLAVPGQSEDPATNSAAIEILVGRTATPLPANP